MIIYGQYGLNMDNGHKERVLCTWLFLYDCKMEIYAK